MASPKNNRPNSNRSPTSQTAKTTKRGSSAPGKPTTTTKQPQKAVSPNGLRKPSRTKALTKAGQRQHDQRAPKLSEEISAGFARFGRYMQDTAKFVDALDEYFGIK